MDIGAGLFCEGIGRRQVPGPSTRIDLSGIMFSLPAPSDPPVTIAPHLVVIIRCRPEDSGTGTLEVVFVDEAGEQVARQASPVMVEPGKFTRQLVKGELTYPALGTIEARCRMDQGPVTAVPLTLLPPLA